MYLAFRVYVKRFLIRVRSNNKLRRRSHDSALQPMSEEHFVGRGHDPADQLSIYFSVL